MIIVTFSFNCIVISIVLWKSVELFSTAISDCKDERDELAELASLGKRVYHYICMVVSCDVHCVFCNIYAEILYCALNG